MNVIEADLHAYVDGCLDPGRRAELEAWLAGNAVAAARVDAWRRQKEALRLQFDGALEEPVPDRLQRAALRGPSRLWGIAAALGWIAVGGTAGFLLRGQPAAPPPMASVVHQAVIAHALYVPEVRHPVEVAAEQEAHLVQWLSKRLGTTVRAPDLQATGFKLVGGRLLPGEGGPAAQFMYQDGGGRRVTLYLRSGSDARETAFRYAREGGLTAFYWVDRGTGYALTGDMAREELLALAEATYRQLEAGARGKPG
jgi:anti-sigma factor RsiW